MLELGCKYAIHVHTVQVPFVILFTLYGVYGQDTLTISKFMYPTYYTIFNSEYMYNTTEVWQHLILYMNVHIYIYSTVRNPYHFQMCK